jgi:glycosyl transferase family 25
MDITIITLVILLICLLYNLKYKTHEKFVNNVNINYYVIHMKNSNNNKYDNVIKNEKILKKKINIYDAVVGKNVDLNNLSNIDPKITFNFNYNYIGEIGCYLSHMLLIKSLINSDTKYTVIFEDDLKILDENLDDKINKITSDLDDNFDMIYLGNLNNNHYEKIKDNIYTINKADFLWGTHAYIINNKNAKKIYDSLLNIDVAIDNKFKNNINNDTLKAYVIYPILVDQNTDELKSDIRPNAIKSVYKSIL